MSSPFGKLPPGTDLSENNAPRNNATVVAMCVLAAVAIVLRIVARIRVQHAKIAADDWLILQYW